jgi:spermidine synthase
MFSFQYGEYFDLQAGHYIRLVDKCKVQTIMTDTPMERRSNLAFVRRAHGHVLIGGLGIGMVVKALDDKADVSSITVIEIEQEIIDLVLPDLQQSCLMPIEVICADINEWRPPKGIKYNAIYFDIWNDVNGDNYEEMKFLHRSWARRVDRTDKFFFGSWRKRDTKEMVW